VVRIVSISCLYVPKGATSLCVNEWDCILHVPLNDPKAFPALGSGSACFLASPAVPGDDKTSSVCPFI